MAIADQVAIQLADLGLATRDEVYAPDADKNGIERHTSQAAQAAVASAAMQHRTQALNSGDSRAQKWNTPDNFEDVGEQGLTNFADGQGYRAEIQSRALVTVPRFASQRNTAASSSHGHVGSRGLSGFGQGYDIFGSSREPRGTIYEGSTRSSGTASGGQAQYAAFVAERGGPPTGTQRHVTHDQSTSPHVKNSAAADKMRKKIFPARPAPAAHPAPAPMMSTMEKQSQQQFDDLVAAAKAGTVDDVILRSQGDFPKIAKIKLRIIDGAIDHSNPSGILLSEDPECLNIFHATRVWLVDLAFYLIRLRDETKFKEKLEIMKMTVSPHFESGLFKVAKEAMVDVATRPHDVLQLEYRLAGKLDVLEKAIELHRVQTIKNVNTLVKDTTKVIKDTTKVSTSSVIIAPAAEGETTVPTMPVDDDSDMPDLDSVSNEAVDGDSDVSDTPVNFVANVTTTVTTVSPTAQPDRILEATQDVPGTAHLSFSDGISEFGPLTEPLAPGLVVNLFVSFDRNQRHLRNMEIYLGAFTEMVEAFKRRVTDAKADEDDAADEASTADEDAAVDSDAATGSDGSGFGTDAAYKILRNPAAQYTGDTSDSDESL